MLGGILAARAHPCANHRAEPSRSGDGVPPSLSLCCVLLPICFSRFAPHLAAGLSLLNQWRARRGLFTHDFSSFNAYII